MCVGVCVGPFNPMDTIAHNPITYLGSGRNFVINFMDHR